jgi:CheY-like chemotaxis protein/nitrogen-specific signal transduction histidine kinase
MQPYFYSIIAQWAMFFGARVINQLYKTMRESQRKIALLRSIMTDMVGHEIGTPLQAIFNNLELLQLFQGTIRTTAVDKTPIDKSFRVIESLRRSVQQVQSVLDNASITVNNKGKSTTGTPAIDDINLINLLEEIINDFSPRASERQLTIKLNLDHPTPAQVSLDKTRITQIVSNLLSNAIKYSDHGEITVSAASRWRDECQISVKDSGIGIPQEAIDDIFEPYFRLPEARNRGVKGSGLGLAVVKRELDVLDGRIKVTSKLGCGSEFKFFVPAKIHNFSLRTEPLLDQVTILVVDDSNIVLDAACQIFGMTKFRCITASDGGKAIDMLRTEPVDIVFLDIQMPVADGFIVAKTLRTDPDFSLNAHVPVIAMSTDEPSPTQGETNHFTHFMKKPFAFNGSLVSRFIMDARSGRSAQTANT